VIYVRRWMSWACCAQGKKRKKRGVMNDGDRSKGQIGAGQKNTLPSQPGPYTEIAGHHVFPLSTITVRQNSRSIQNQATVRLYKESELSNHLHKTYTYQRKRRCHSKQRARSWHRRPASIAADGRSDTLLRRAGRSSSSSSSRTAEGQ